jgi:bifunctional DNase/RNase
MIAKFVKTKVYKVEEDSVILHDLEDKSSLSIVIDKEQVASIKQILEKTTMSRPSTHNLMKDILDNTGLKVSVTTITECRGGTFHSSLKLVNKKEEFFIFDSRPSDSIAMALQYGAVIFVDEKLLKSI